MQVERTGNKMKSTQEGRGKGEEKSFFPSFSLSLSLCFEEEGKVGLRHIVVL